MTANDNIHFDKIQKGAFIKESIEILHNAYLVKKLVLFVGAGVDFTSGIPLWKRAIEEFCMHLNIKPDDADVLKIPQIYYNSRGKKEYVELCRKIFRFEEELPINKLHKKIVDLNVSTIITTNYTDFLEREMRNRGHIYKTICQDRDLPYTHNEKLVVKMHGDFEHNNFVLKEDDYLEYSSNFRLIETYIKAVLAKNVVLFVGYSFNDPDMKQIFSWVKGVLGNDFQQAYMLESYHDYDENMFEYYKNLGANVIYTKLFSKDSTEIQLILLEMIKSGIRKSLSATTAAAMYLKPLRELDYVLAKYLNKGLRKCGIYLDNSGVLDVHSVSGESNCPPRKMLDELAKLLKNETEAADDAYSIIADVLRRSGAIYMPVLDADGAGLTRFDILHKRNLSVELLQTFDYAGLRAEADRIDFFKRDDEQAYLKQAYIYYVLEEYGKAYGALYTAAEKAFQKHRYYTYYISQYNKFKVKELIGRGCLSIPVEIRDKINEDLKSVSLEDIIMDIPDLASTDNQILKDISSFQFHYSMFQDAYSTSQKVKEQQETQYFTYSGIPSYQTLQWMIRDYYHYITYNCLMVDNYRELQELFQLYLRSILGSATAPDKNSTDGSLPTRNVAAASIGSFELFLMIKYMSEKDIRNIISQCGIRFLPVQDGCRSYIRNVLKNLENEKSLKCDRELWNCLALISYMELESDLAEEAVDCISRKFNYFSYCSHKETIRLLLSNCCEKKCLKPKREGVFEPETYALGRFLKHAVHQAVETDETGIRAYINIVPLLSFCYYDFYDETFDGNIGGLLHIEKILILAKMYPYCGDANKNIIRNFFQKEIKGADWVFFDRYGEAVLNGILVPDRDFEQKIYNNINVIKEKSQGCYPNTYQDILITMFNLYGKGKIIDTNRLKSILRQSEDAMLIFLSDMEGFDYSVFDINWLQYFSDGLLADIAQCETARVNICRKFAEQIESYNVGSPLLKKFFRYFVS